MSKITTFCIWIIITAVMFYRGSAKVDMWGKWQGFEIVIPLVISMLLAGVLAFCIKFLMELLT